MFKSNHLERYALLATLVCGVAALPTRATVSLSLSDLDATPAVGTVAADSTFSVHVLLTASAASDRISTDTYRFVATNSGGVASNQYFQIASRSQTPAQATTLTPYSPTFAAQQLTANTNLGGYVPDGVPDLSGTANGTVFDTVTYNLLVVGAPAGTYTLAFRPFASTSFTGARDINGNTGNDLAFGGLGTYIITVPEPTALAGLAATVGLGLRRRRRV